MFADPSAAAKASADKQGLTGNSAWGRRMRALKAARHREANQRARIIPLAKCSHCGQTLPAPAKQTNPIIQARLAQYAAQQAQAEDEA